MAGATLFTLVRNDQLELAASVPARQANAIVPGQAVRFVADGQALEGRVARVSPTINTASRSIAVYLQVANPGGRLKGNTFATGRIIGRTIADALVVPAAVGSAAALLLLILFTWHHAFAEMWHRWFPAWETLSAAPITTLAP